MRPRSLARTLLVPLALVTACAASHARRNVPLSAPATLEVHSTYIGPLDLYAVSDNGFMQRIASSVGSRTERFKLPNSLLGGGGTIRIIAVPLAENGRASTGRIVVRPGDIVQFNISPNLAASSVFIR